MSDHPEDFSDEELESLLEEIKVLNQFSMDNTGTDFGKYFKDVFNYDFVEKDKTTTKFVNKSNNPDPEYAKEGDSGFDLRAFIEEPITLKPLERKLIPTGLSFELPPNTELQVRPRSGMALKHGISCLNTPGTVDEGYRGDVGVIAVNLSNEEYTIQPGERIAQGVIMNVIGQRISNLSKVETLSETERGDGGFGSTGKN
jgi:dUTP pyrophosphatase